MKRREFVKTLPVLALSPLLLSAGPAKAKNLLVLGSAATRLIATYGTELKADTTMLVNDINRENQGFSFDFSSNRPPASAYLNIRGIKSFHNYHLAQIKLPEAIADYLGEIEGKLVVFAALGEFTGTSLYQAVANYVSEHNIEAHFICSLPFDFEGSRRMEDAVNCADYVGARCSQEIFPLEQIRKQYGNLGIASAFDQADLCLKEKVKLALK